MAISYNRLWKLLIDKNISKAELRRMIKISPNTMTRLNQNEDVSLGVLIKICQTLNVDFGDIIEYIDTP